MKHLFCFILIFSFCLNAYSQPLDGSIKYIWKNDLTNISAAVEIYGLQNKNHSFSIFYLNSVDTVYNTISDSLFKSFINISALNCPVIKINFYNVLDTPPQVKIKLYAEEFSKYILSDIAKKYGQIPTDNIILSGSNYFGLVALFAALADPNKINKTALFFNGDKEQGLLNNVNLSDSKKLKGKLYLYVNHQNIENEFTDSLANNLGANSTAVLYKYDFFGKAQSPDIFTEAYRWLLADGNNYIIKNVD